MSNIVKLLCLILVELLVIISVMACSKLPEIPIKTSDNIIVKEASSRSEVCYKGVVYVKFGYSETTSWGGVRFTPDGKVVTCSR